METERSIDRLARYTIYTAVFAVVCALCWYFRSALLYIILAAIVSLIGRPVMRLLKKIRIKGWRAPDWVLAIITLFLLILLFLLIITQTIPVVTRIIGEASLANISQSYGSTSPMADINQWLISVIPGLGPDFKLETSVINGIKGVLNISNISSVIGSVASVIADIGIGIFAVVFISFFFIKDDSFFRKIISSLVPDKIEKRTLSAITDIEHLLTRYFVGLLIEMLGVALLNFLGLWIIARLGFSAAIGIAFITGILNIVPYIGPLAGYVIGTTLGIVLKYGTATGLGLDALLVFTAIILAILIFTQIIDNFIYQPVIYSNSIKASALEIFIVLLLAGHVGGILGMLAAIPAYTVVRVVASRFFYDVKAIRRLMPDLSKEEQLIRNEEKQ